MKNMRSYHKEILLCMILLLTAYSHGLNYPVVDTGTQSFFSNDSIISAPAAGTPFYGQDASYQGFQPSYTDNGDGTISDNVTGLMWQKDMGARISYNDAKVKADTLTLAGYTLYIRHKIKLDTI